MNYYYLAIDFLTILVPFIFSFHPKINFYKQWKPFWKANILVAFIFVVWDMLFTKLGVWGFNPRYLLGVNLLNIPLEEVLFFICIPYSCVFTYHCLTLFFTFRWNAKAENIFVITLSALLLIVGAYLYSHLYTSSVFISLGILLLLMKYVLRVEWLGKLFIIYSVLLIPFFIVNGILTGTGLDEPIVWYNNAQNLNFRLLTIPFEDVFYGFELILLNVFFYERFKL